MLPGPVPDVFVPGGRVVFGRLDPEQTEAIPRTNRGGTVGRAELAEQVVGMGPDGAGGNAEVLSDLGVAPAICHTP
jgi:hypothetical protein